MTREEVREVSEALSKITGVEIRDKEQRERWKEITQLPQKGIVTRKTYRTRTEVERWFWVEASGWHTIDTRPECVKKLFNADNNDGFIKEGT